MTDNFYVCTIYLGEWRYMFPGTNQGGNVPPGYAVCSAGVPVVYRSKHGHTVTEVYDLKAAAQGQADYLNRRGLSAVLGEPIHEARERGRFPHILRKRA